MLHVTGNYSHSRKYETTGPARLASSRCGRTTWVCASVNSTYARDWTWTRNDDMVEFFRLVMARREQQGWD